MRALFPILAILAAAAPACTAINPDCDAAMLKCYLAHPDAWEKECLAKIDMTQPPDMAPVKNGLGWSCNTNDDCSVPWVWPARDMSPAKTFNLTCYDLGEPYGKRCCAEVQPNVRNCAP